MKTRVVNIHKESYDVFIGRPSKWGNPFVVGKDGTRQQVIAKYRAYVTSNPSLLSKVKHLRGKRLGCYCKPLACHGDVLVELAEQL